MKVLSEKEIKKLSAEAKKVTDEKGEKVQPWKFVKPRQEQHKKKDNWLRNYFGMIVAAMQGTSKEQKELNGIMLQIVKALREKPEKEEKEINLVVDTAKKWTFTISRDERGFINEVEAIRKE